MSQGASVRLLTPTGVGGIAVIELSGPEAQHLLGQCFRTSGSRCGPSPGTVCYGHIVARDEVLDEVIVCRVPCETPVYEINSHGGLAAARRVLSLLVELGAKRVDWSEAELGRPLGALERLLFEQLLETRTQRAAEVLLVQLGGKLRAQLEAIEACLPARSEEALKRIDSLLATRRFGRRLCEPATVVVTGAPNVGKSTLANALAGRSRSIVHHLPGTTRDAVRSVVSLGGLPVVIVDTAGLRQATDEIERLGVSVALDEAAACDLVVWVFDHSRPIRDGEAVYLEGLRRLPLLGVINKIDLSGPLDETRVRRLLAGEVLRTCALTGRGIEALRQKMVTTLVGELPPRDAAVVTLGSLARDLDETARRVKSGEKRMRFNMIQEDNQE